MDPDPATDDRGSTTVGLQAATFDSYAGRRYIRANLNFSAVDQLEIVRGLWEYMQGAEGGRIGVEYETTAPTVSRTVAYRDGDETLVEEAIGQLAAMEPGFEYRIAVYRDPVTGRRVKLLQLGSPKIQVGSQPVMLDLPGDVLSYAFPRDATRGGTTTRARGGTPEGGASGPVLSGEQVAQDLIAAGFPRLDTTSDHSNVTDKATLDAFARSELAALRGPVVIPSVRIRLGSDTTPALLGTTVRLRIKDVWFSEGLDARYRVVGTKVTAPSGDARRPPICIWRRLTDGEPARGHRGPDQGPGTAGPPAHHLRQQQTRHDAGHTGGSGAATTSRPGGSRGRAAATWSCVREPVTVMCVAAGRRRPDVP
ncbi:hypothetical protein SAZ11_54200 [Streptomyces sp. FXJ1.4098]|nr:hypothetical protein [Streptomyces sp. FXJ1.4098]